MPRGGSWKPYKAIVSVAELRTLLPDESRFQAAKLLMGDYVKKQRQMSNESQDTAVARVQTHFKSVLIPEVQAASDAQIQQWIGDLSTVANKRKIKSEAAEATPAPMDMPDAPKTRRVRKAVKPTLKAEPAKPVAMAATPAPLYRENSSSRRSSASTSTPKQRQKKTKTAYVNVKAENRKLDKWYESETKKINKLTDEAIAAMESEFVRKNREVVEELARKLGHNEVNDTNIADIHDQMEVDMNKDKWFTPDRLKEVRDMQSRRQAIMKQKMDSMNALFRHYQTESDKLMKLNEKQMREKERTVNLVTEIADLASMFSRAQTRGGKCGCKQ